MSKFDVDFTETCSYSFTVEAPSRNAVEKWCEIHGGDVISENLKMGQVDDRNFEIVAGDKKNEVDFEVSRKGETLSSWRRDGKRLVNTVCVTIQAKLPEIKIATSVNELLGLIDKRRQEVGYLSEMFIELCRQFDTLACHVSPHSEGIEFVARGLAQNDHDDFYKTIESLMKSKNAKYTFKVLEGDRKPESRRKRP